LDTPKLDEPQISILDRHVTKFPLGGVSPEMEAVPVKETVVEKETAPENPDRHAIKFPLGGVSPEKAVPDPVKNQDVPGDPNGPSGPGTPRRF
jgi:hypothetical protein